MPSPSNVPDPYHPQQVRQRCREVVQEAQHVRLERAGIEAWPRHFDPAALAIGHPAELRPTRSDPESLARFALLCNSLNFSFFPDDPAGPWIVRWRDRDWQRYEAFAAAWCRTIQADATWLDPQRWSCARLEELREVFHGEGTIPMLPERLAVLRGVGEAMVRRFDGSVTAMISRAESRAGQIVGALCEAVGSFVDVPTYRGRAVPILKRAQLFVADLANLWKPIGREIAELEVLTAFADYRLPAALRGLGVLRASDELADRIERGQWLAPGESAEVELRAGTVIAVDEMVRVARQDGLDLQAWQVDWWLWRYARQIDSQLPPHHRVRSIYY